MSAPARPPDRLERATRIGAALVLAAAALSVLHAVYAFAQTRHFAIDEWQYGHATWLVAQGQRPYVDFYEHHFPGLFVLHAPLLPESGDFGERALWLRTFVFGHLLLVAGGALLATAVTTRSVHAALLAAALPLAFGFAFLTQVDYRSDVFGGALFLLAACLVEANRRWRSRAAAGGAGALVGLAVLATQKMGIAAGASALLAAAVELARRVRRSGGTSLVAHPGSLVLAAGGVLALALAAAAAAGVLPAAAELTLVDALRHEEAYPSRPIAAFGTYAWPFLRETWATTLPLLALALWFLLRERPPFWAVFVAAALVVAWLAKARYPYNFALPCWLLVLCAVRGFAGLVPALSARLPRAAAPLLWLLPLLVLPDQLGFAREVPSNAHQLHLLRKLQRFSTPEDAVIDNAGGALFRPPASYFHFHGAAHHRVYDGYFFDGLLRDYRESGALFWILDMRMADLPPEVMAYFRDHYVQVDGDLYGLGFRIPAAEGGATETEVDVVRGDVYLAHPIGRGEGAPPAGHPLAGRVRIDGRLLREPRVALEPGRHRVVAEPGTPAFLLTPLPAEAFRSPVSEYRDYSLLLLYDGYPEPGTGKAFER